MDDFPGSPFVVVDANFEFCHPYDLFAMEKGLILRQYLEDNYWSCCPVDLPATPEEIREFLQEQCDGWPHQLTEEERLHFESLSTTIIALVQKHGFGNLRFVPTLKTGLLTMDVEHLVDADGRTSNMVLDSRGNGQKVEEPESSNNAEEVAQPECSDN